MIDVVRRQWPWIAAAAAAVLAVVLVGPPTPGVPLDPSSARPDGLRGLRDTLEELDVAVEVGRAPTGGTTTVLIVRDGLSDDARADLRRWAEEGGDLVVGDPTSPLADVEVGGRLLTDLVGPTSLEPGCDIPVVRGVRSVASSRWVGLRAEEASAACFPVADGFWMVRIPRGAGTLTLLGGPDPLVNARLGSEDNAVLAANLLASGAAPEVLLVPPGSPGGGDAGLLELVPGRVWSLIGLLLLAFVVLSLARGRRHGVIVEDAMPVRVPGSSTVTATAEASRRAGHAAHAATVLQRSLRRDLIRHLGLAPDADADTIAAAASDGVIEADVVTALLGSRGISDDEALLALSRAIARVRARLRSRRRVRPRR